MYQCRHLDAFSMIEAAQVTAQCRHYDKEQAL